MISDFQAFAFMFTFIVALPLVGWAVDHWRGRRRVRRRLRAIQEDVREGWARR